MLNFDGLKTPIVYVVCPIDTMIREIQSSEFGSLSALLHANGLPTADIESVNWFRLLGDFREDQMVAAAGLELCGEALLLRSVATADACQGQGLARGLLNRIHAEARAAGYMDCWLLTTDAADYFQGRQGYRVAERDLAPKGIRQSEQFSSLCPGDATLMVRQLVT